MARQFTKKKIEYWGQPRKYNGETRVCYRCKREKALDEFKSDRRKFQGKAYICKVCHSGKGYGSCSGLRWEVLSRDQFTCQYCGAKAPDVKLEPDHILPRVLGGLDSLDNLITACEPCNRGKSDRIS